MWHGIGLLFLLVVSADAVAADDACRIESGASGLVLRAPDARVLPEGDLVVRSIPAKDTGTMHYAEISTLFVGDGPPLSLDGELIGHQIRLDATRYLVLGWSSQGAGMQTQSAFLVHRTADALHVTDRLRFESTRPDGRLLLRVDGARVSVGVLVRESWNAGAWSLSVGGREFDLGGLRRRDAWPLSAGSCDFASYHPPFGESPGAELNDDRVIWFDARADRFVLRRRH